jgi:hypothetical protein
MANADDLLSAAARMSFQAAGHGDFRGFDQIVPHLAQSRAPEPQAWRLALGAIRWSFDPGAGLEPSIEAAARAAEASAPAAAIVARVCAVMERVAFCTFDRPRLSAWIGLHGTAAARGAGNRDSRDSEDITLSAARLLERLLAGKTAGLDELAKALFDTASRQSAGAEVIESTVIRALLALSAGALGDAIDLGRRASRMAQSEALSQPEYLANITLARVRRYSGRPHLALHILAALRRVAPRSWSGWIGWETLLAGGKASTAAAPDQPDGVEPPSANAERCLRDFLDAARAGVRPAFVTATDNLESAAGIWPHLAGEVAALLAALDPTRETIPDSMAAWCRGDNATIPYGLHGVGIPQDAEPQTETTTAYVLAQPGERGRRFLFPGLPLAPRAQMLARDSVSSGARTETGIAALALAGEGGTSRDGFFRSVYGFPFVAYRHRAVLDVLCHRMRGLLGESGEIRREGGDAGAANGPAVEAPPSPSAGPSLALVLNQAIIVPDMRCVLPTADRVLRALAIMGATSASAAAESLRMPLRTVQAVLQQLVAEGACTIERDGRRVAYRIEDTTFTEVTAA